MSECLSCNSQGKFPFCRLSSAAREFLDGEVVTIEYPKGNLIFGQGETADAIYILCSGKVKLSTISHDGRAAILRIAQEGDVLGVSAFLNETSHEVAAEAMQRSRLQRFRRRTLQTLLTQFPAVSLELAKAIDRDYRSAYQDVRRIALPDSPAGRVARLLLDWAHDNKVPPGNALIMPLTQDELAAMTATTRETISRTLSRFRRERLISMRGVAVTILQPNGLLQLCG